MFKKYPGTFIQNPDINLIFFIYKKNHMYNCNTCHILRTKNTKIRMSPHHTRCISEICISSKNSFGDSELNSHKYKSNNALLDLQNRKPDKAQQG